MGQDNNQDFNRQQQQAGQDQGQQGGFDQNNAQQQQGESADNTTADVQPHQHVHDADGNHVGTVDHVDGDRIKLTKNDSADGQHHYVSLSDVDRVDGGTVRLRSGVSTDS